MPTHGRHKLKATVLVFAALASLAAAAQGWQGPDVVIIEHTYDGAVQRTGRITWVRYAWPVSHVEWVDTFKDGIFRSGFDYPQHTRIPTNPCKPENDNCRTP